MSNLSRRHLLTAALSIWPATVFAGPAPRDDPPPPDELLDATQTVQLEHSDRIFRLRQATERLGIDPPPQFSTYTVPAERMPDYFHVDTPILRVIFDDAIFFDTASDVARPEAHPILDAVSQALRGDAPDAAVFVAGHTDNRGDEAYNYNLSINRANAVAEGLLDRGVGEVALWRVGFGEAVPLYPNDTPVHMGLNRRVEFLFSARTEGVFDYLSRQLENVCVGADVRTADVCRQQVHVREEFTAVQLTRRPMGVGLAGARTRRPASSGLSTSTRSGAGVAPGQRRISTHIVAPVSNRTAVGHAPSHGTVNADTDRVVAYRANINLHSQQVTLNAAR